jgi:purine-binding chemotaxis protein CheW
MIVDAASEVLKIPESDIESAPGMMLEGGLDCVTGLGKYKGRLIILLDVGKVLDFRKSANPETASDPAAPSTGKAAAQSASAGNK